MRKSSFYGWYISQSPVWKAKRRQCLARDGGKCRRCGSAGGGKALHVHHRTYARLGDERLSDLLTLCISCHDIIHGRTAGTQPVDTTVRIPQERVKEEKPVTKRKSREGNGKATRKRVVPYGRGQWLSDPDRTWNKTPSRDTRKEVSRRINGMA